VPLFDEMVLPDASAPSRPARLSCVRRPRRRGVQRSARRQRPGGAGWADVSDRSLETYPWLLLRRPRYRTTPTCSSSMRGTGRCRLPDDIAGCVRVLLPAEAAMLSIQRRPGWPSLAWSRSAGVNVPAAIGPLRRVGGLRWRGLVADILTIRW